MNISGILAFTFTVCIIAIWIRWRKKRMSLFERYDIPGPKPDFFTGNMKDFHETRNKCVNDWLKKYGKIFGFFFGAKPFIVCADPELIKILEIKEFKKFTNKDLLLPDAGIPHKLSVHFLGLLNDEEWKNTRSILSNSFTSGKIKMMSTLMNEPINVFLENIEKENEEYFNIAEFYKKLIFDLICKAAFGAATNVQKNETNKFVQSTYKIFDVDSVEVLSILSVCFPEVEPIPTYIRQLIESAKYFMNRPVVDVVFDTCRQIIASRKKSEYRPPDLLQTILDAESESIEEHKKLSSDFVLANAVNLMVAAYETTNTTLAWITYYVAHHREVQNKIREEINVCINTNEDIEYADLVNLKYMDQVISESLRLSPLQLIAVNRVCAEDFKYKDITIPKGAAVIVAVPQLQRDPAYWPEPDVFDPDRFLPENRAKIDQSIYQPFGAGPRNCIGMRLAQTIMKMTLASLIRAFKLEPNRNVITKIPSESVYKERNNLFETLLPQGN